MFTNEAPISEQFDEQLEICFVAASKRPNQTPERA
jgi:hypothetical protein